MGCTGAAGVHCYPGAAGHHCSDSGGRDWRARRLRVWSVARISLFDDRSHYGFAVRILARPPAWRAVHQTGDGTRRLETSGLRRRGRGCDPVFHYLSRSRSTEDTLCYLFGVSPIPFWVFALVSTLGRMPGTWVLSAGGAKAAAAQYVQLLLLVAVVAALIVPLYYYRSRIVLWLRRRA